MKNRLNFQRSVFTADRSIKNGKMEQFTIIIRLISEHADCSGITIRLQFHNPTDLMNQEDIRMKKAESFTATEILSLREEYAKTYAVGAGKFQAFTGSIPLHIRSGGEWADCDARFVPDKEREEGTLISHGSRFVTVCKPSGAESFISLTDEKGHSLSWSLEEAEKREPEALAVETGEKGEDGSAEALFLKAVERAQGSVLYPGVFPGVDMRCYADARFKDEFVFSEPASVRPVTFRVETALRPEYEKDRHIRLLDASGEPVFIICPPVLYDANGSEGAVAVQFEPSEKGFFLTCSPDPDFASSAAYPVVLDPVTETVSGTSGIVDTFVRQNYTNNYSTSERLWITNSSSYGLGNSYLKVTSLPSLNSNHFITEATLRLSNVLAPASADGMLLLAKEPLADWQPATVTYANQPSLSSVYQDGWLIPQGSTSVCFIDVTALAKKWYTGQNYGVALVPRENDTTVISLASADYNLSSHKPVFILSYSSLAGLEDYLIYDSQSAGRAGTGYVSLHNGNMIFAHSDTRMNGARMPVSVTHFYNSCDANKNDFYMGKGWRTNLHQTLHKAYLNNTVHYVYTDGDGTQHYFQSTNSGNTQYRDLSGLGLTLVPGDTVTVTDKGNNVLTFPPVTATPTASNPVTDKVLLASMKDACGNTASITATGMKITKVTDGAGRETTFAYASNLCSRIQAPWQASTTCTRFAYTGSKLTTVTYEDHTEDVPKQSTYTYSDQNGFALLTGAAGSEGISIAYTYMNTSASSGLPHCVTRATVTAGTLTGSDVSYTYGHLLTKVHNELSGKTIRYHFNNDGNMISVDDEAGYARYTAYDRTGSNADAPVNHATELSRTQQVTTNMLKDGLLNDNSSAWVTGGTGTFTRDSGNRMWGSVSQKITIEAGNTASVRQQLTLTPGSSYTFSAWVKSSRPKAYLRVMYTQNGSSVYISSSPVVSGESTFQRIAVSFTLPQDAGANVNCYMMCATAAGSAWFDALQLERGLTLNHFNLLQNSDFSAGSGTLPDHWTASYSSQYDFAETKPFSQCDYTPPNILTGRAVRVRGLHYAITGAYQQFTLHGSQGDRFSAGGWCGGYARKHRENNPAGCKINVLFSSGGETWYSGGTVSWNSTEGQWQFASSGIVAPLDYSKVKFAIEYSRQVNYAFFACLFLYPETFAAEFVYDGKGNRTSARRLYNKTESAEYDAYNNMTSYTGPGETVCTTFDYGSSATQKKKHLLLKSVSPLGTVTVNTYNSYGSPTRTDIKDEDSDTAKFIRTATAYSGGNYASSQTDARGKTVSTVTDADKGTVTSVTDPDGQQVSYTYDSLRRLKQVSTTAADMTYKTDYLYNAKDCLTRIRHNTTGNSFDVSYNFVYDALGRQTQAKVGSRLLNRNTYTGSGIHTGVLSKITYGNGDTVSYSYDAFNRVKGVSINGEATPRYTYEYNARGQAAYLKDSALNRVRQTEYDLADRPCRVQEYQGASHLYTGEVRYDTAKGNLQSFTERAGNSYTKYTTTFTYDNENRPKTLSYGSSDNQTVLTYDKLGRITKRVVKLDGYSYSSTYSYTAGGHGDNSTTGLVAKITQNGETHTYTYNNTGNIATVKRGTKTTKYTYDALGQLTRVDDQDDTSSGDTGTTWTYEYDRGGNLLNKKRYAYTTATNSGTVLQTVTCTYGDPAWKDKLTKYSSIEIPYDDIGNPLSYNNWTYTWEKGRQLKKAERSDGLTVEYSYNAEGLRVQKKVTGTTGTVTTTDYTLHGSNVVHLVRGNKTLHFFYDAQNRPAIVEYNGTKYAYVYNLQGDVMGLIDNTGEEVLKYTYNAWGRVLSVTGSMASTLGPAQPFRYRGYIYDTETGLYYLRSRYYNPTWQRFINADVLVKGNLYQYCINQPISIYDPFGYEEQDIIIEDVDLDDLFDGLIMTHSQKISGWKRKKWVTVSTLFERFENFILQETNFRSETDSGCGMFIRAGIMGKTGPHGTSACFAGASSMFNNDMILTGNISDIGGPLELTVGMIVGTKQAKKYDDGKYHIEHVGVYAGLVWFEKYHQYLPAVYSFNTDINKPNLLPFSANEWVYYGWHERIALD